MIRDDAYLILHQVAARFLAPVLVETWRQDFEQIVQRQQEEQRWRERLPELSRWADDGGRSE